MKQYISKEYEFKEELGKGSYSLCRRCIYKENGKEYAVKVSSFVNFHLIVTRVKETNCKLFTCSQFLDIGFASAF